MQASPSRPLRVVGVQHRADLGCADDFEGVQGRRVVAGRTANDAQARR